MRSAGGEVLRLDYHLRPLCARAQRPCNIQISSELSNIEFPGEFGANPVMQKIQN